MTPRAKKAMDAAIGEAQRANAPEAEPGHLIAGMLAIGQGIAHDVLMSQGLTLEKCRAVLKDAVVA